MAYVDIVTALALLQFIVFGFKVGSARGKYGVKAPAVTGNEIFERHFRVQQNTLEQLIAFIPGMYLFSHYFNPLWSCRPRRRLPDGPRTVRCQLRQRPGKARSRASA